MKKHIALFIAIAVAVLAICFYTQRDRPWYGRCVFGPTSEVSIEFIVLGDAVYLDRNVDGKPQPDELLPKSKVLEVPSKNGESDYQIRSVGVFYSESATSIDSPQVLGLDGVTGADFPYAMCGALVLSRDREMADTCHLFGPLAIHVFSSNNYPPDRQFCPGNEAVIKVGLITVDETSAAISPDLGPTSALVYSSVEPDRNTCAFDSTVRPELEIVFETSTTSSKQRLTIDEFC